MPPVLLRISWLDAFKTDSESDPPDRKFGKVPQRVSAGERHAVIATNGSRQTVTATFGGTTRWSGASLNAGMGKSNVWPRLTFAFRKTGIALKNGHKYS